MPGFRNYVATKLGKLTIAALQSPNFVTGVSGWIIRKNGSAEFNSLTVRGTFSGTDYEITADGSFYYDRTQGPGLGTLSVAIANSAGTDSYGNDYNAGVSVFQVVAKGSGQPTLVASLDPDGNLQFGPGTSGNPGIYIDAPTGQMLASGISAFHPGTNASEGWQHLAKPSGWTDHSSTGSDGFRYRLMPDGRVLMAVDLKAPSTAPANGTQIGTMPADYIPGTTAGHIPLATSVSPASGAQGPHLDINTDGTVKCYGIGGGAVVGNTAGWYSLD